MFKTRFGPESFGHNINGNMTWEGLSSVHAACRISIGGYFKAEMRPIMVEVFALRYISYMNVETNWY
jgi:hypothetical protein